MEQVGPNYKNELSNIDNWIITNIAQSNWPEYTKTFVHNKYNFISCTIYFNKNIINPYILTFYIDDKIFNDIDQVTNYIKEHPEKYMIQNDKTIDTNLIEQCIDKAFDEQYDEIYVSKLSLFQKLRCHIGEDFYSPSLGTVKLINLYNDYYIKVQAQDGSIFELSEEGIWLESSDAEVFIYPTKENRDWNKWYIETNKTINVNINFNINTYNLDLDILDMKMKITNNLKHLIPGITDNPHRIIDEDTTIS